MKKIIVRILKFGSLFILSFGLILMFIIFGVGDGGLTQSLLNGIEKRALAKQDTWRDRLFLQTIYQSMIYVGYWKYPYASKFLHHYCHQKGDTLFYDANFLLQNKEVQMAIKKEKKIVIFRPITVERPHWHIPKQTYWDLYYTFDLLFMRKEGDKIIFYDNYTFFPLAKKSYTPFKIGRIKFSLNDGLIHIAYPHAKGYISYGQARL